MRDSLQTKERRRADYDCRIRRYNLFTGPTSSPPTTLTMAKPLVLRVRALADERDIQISDLVFTAVLLHLDEAPPSAVAA